MSGGDEHDTQVAMVRSSAAAVAPRSGDLARIRALRFKTPDFDLSVWRQIAELGWIGIALPEDQGGIGLGMAETIALTEELGRGLTPEPLIAASMSARLLAAAGETALLQDVLVGKTLVATAWAVHADAIQPADMPSAPRRFVAMSGRAEAYLFPEKSGARLALRLVEAKDVAITTEPLQDGGLAATIVASSSSGRTLSNDVGPAFGQAFDEAALATASYLLGVSERAFEITIEYLKMRRQFDQPLAAFQALQHRVVDMKIQLVLCRASVEGAAATLDAGADSYARAMAVSRAKARAADTVMLVGREAVQLHGAIGYTDEYDVGLFARKAMVVANQYGSAAAHRRRFITLSEGQV
jgi:alkylation response protein AidB-like acyl-CoA dehydrogenase